jgi:dipeptidyl aminopeptidase/acylaminoacyl peptidase
VATRSLTATRGGRRARQIITALLLASGLATLAYTGLSAYVATQLVYAPPLPISERPSDLSPPLAYREVTFPAREDGVRLSGWLIPGVRPDNRLTVERAIFVVHGTRTNREDNDPVHGVRILDWSADLACHGFAVLAFDMRGMGASPPAPLSLGYFEQRDVLGAVDDLRRGPLAYPELGRPRLIGRWGVSMGGATLLLAEEQEPAIQAR